MDAARVKGGFCNVTVRTTMFCGFQERHLTIKHRTRDMMTKLVINEDAPDNHRITVSSSPSTSAIMLLDDNALAALKEVIDGYFQLKAARPANADHELFRLVMELPAATD